MSTIWAIYWMVLGLVGVCQLDAHEDPASYQLVHYFKEHPDKRFLTRDSGQPLDSSSATLTAGKKGPVLLQDFNFIELISKFDRERIPERVVHAKGAGAFGYFEVTHDITKYTKAKLFEEIGKKVPIAVRFSPVTPERGGSEVTRNPRGFAIKFWTPEGIWDMVGLNAPVFALRDPYLFPLFVHSQKRNPQTNLQDPNMVWDFITLRPETVHLIMILFSDRGIPDGYRHMDGYGVNTYKMVNHENIPVYVKLHFRTDQGLKNIDPERAANISGTDPDYFTRDLFNAIYKKEYPTWTFYIQVMTYEQAEKFRWNPFDDTKLWPEVDFPLIPVGKIVLNKNPTNYFAEVEQIAFNPANLIPGIEPSPDIVLQSRLFSYGDTQRYRLGTNYLQLPVNAPHEKEKIANYNRDGSDVHYNQGGAPNYYPNTFSQDILSPYAALLQFKVTGEAKRYDKGDEDNFSQPAIFWEKVLTEEERMRLLYNIAHSIKGAIMPIQMRCVKLFTKVHPEMGKRLAEKLGIYYSYN